MQDNYVKKPGRAQEPERHDEPKEAPAQDPSTTPGAPAQGPPASPPLALLDTHSVILDKMIYLWQMMMSHFDQMDWRIVDLESTMDSIRVAVDAFQVA